MAGADRSLAAGLALVLLYAVLRTLAVPEPLILGWAAVAAAAALLSPLTGLIVLVVIGPFTEAQTADGAITPAPILVAATAAGAGARYLLVRPRRTPPVPVVLAVALAVGTFLGVGVSAASFGAGAGVDALLRWGAGIGGALGVLVAAWWVGRQGDLRPLIVGVASIVAAAVVSLVQYGAPEAVAASPLAWLTRPLADPNRLSGIIPGPNSAATIFLIGLAAVGSAALTVGRRDIRLAALAAGAPLLLAVALTFSRSALLALLVLLLIGVWQLRHRQAVLLGAALLVAAVVLLAGVTVLSEGFGALPGRGGGDQLRAGAWSATARMWLDSPIWGHGFRSFEWLHLRYGAPLDAPHNEWLRFLAEEGTLVGLIALAFAVATLVALLRSPGWTALAGASAAAVLFVMATFNNPLLYVQVNVPAFLVIGIALGFAERAPPEDVP